MGDQVSDMLAGVVSPLTGKQGQHYLTLESVLLVCPSVTGHDITGLVFDVESINHCCSVKSSSSSVLFPCFSQITFQSFRSPTQWSRA